MVLCPSCSPVSVEQPSGATASTAVPRVGMLATVRNRRGVISAVEPFAAAKSSELLHLVTIEFSDSDGDAEETLLWERERQPVVLEPNALPRAQCRHKLKNKKVRAEFLNLRILSLKNLLLSMP